MKKVILTFLIVVGVLMLALALRKAAQILDTNQTISVRVSPPAPPDAESSEALLALRHPIKAGGVHSVAELLRLINSDPAVAAHYRSQGFRVECASTMVLAANTFARTSYRTPTGFAWTKTPILILAGTDLIVDCEGHLIKMNCANLLELARGPELSADSTWGGVLGAPPDSVIPDIPAPLPPIDVPPPAPPVPPGPPGTPGTPGTSFYPIPCCFVGGGAPPPPPITTPEPATWVMIVGVGVVLIVFRVIRGPR